MHIKDFFQSKVELLASGALFSTIALLHFITIPLTIYLIFFTKYHWLVLLYFTWIYLDRQTCCTGGRPNSWLLSSTWFKLAQKYFNSQLIMPSTRLDPSKNYLFICFPHGVLAAGAFLNFIMHPAAFFKTHPNFKTYLCVLHLMFFLPIVREIVLGMGFISASATSILNILERRCGGHVVALYAGGAEEAVYSAPGRYALVVKKRKGFVKLALKTGASLVPVITFNETDTFEQYTGRTVKGIQTLVRKWIGFSPVLFRGRGLFQSWFGAIPFKTCLITVVGAPIAVEKIENPSEEQVMALHQIFLDSLVELFEQNKEQYSREGKKAVLELLS